MKILYIVRRFGPVGGMERYVWELSRELVGLGCAVDIVCEEFIGSRIPKGIKVYSLGRALSRPRWLSYIIFSAKVNRWINKYGRTGWVIHSHEKSKNHHITTFHGSLFAPVRYFPLWKRFSVRVAANLWLEKREVSIKSIRAIVPCSKLIKERLMFYYPASADFIVDPIPPGVAQGSMRTLREIPKHGGIVGFVGYEWRRKGLDIAIQIVKYVLKSRPNLEFWVAGPNPESIRHLFADFTGKYRLFGNVKSSEFYPQLDLLLHPARQEPFGMVVTEAMAARVWVVVSNDCGVQSEVTEHHGRVLSRGQPLEAWTEACLHLLGNEKLPPGYNRSWKQVAIEHEQLYRKITDEDTFLAS